MTARCKFRITNILNTEPESTAKRIVFETHYDDTIPEDQAFTKYTPTGRMDVVIDNAAVTEKYVVGGFVYVDITPI
jgi:hypothetical protein